MTPDPFAPDLASSTEKKVPFSEKIAQTRAVLLKTLQEQLAEPLAKKLVPQEKGVPFLEVDKQLPQIAAIEKVVNCLFHAEEALKIWENLDYSTPWAIANSSALGVNALAQVYKAVALLYDTSPEIQTLITNNYELLSPVFLEAYNVIQKSGWLPQFGVSDVVGAANTVLSGTNNVLTSPEHVVTTATNDYQNSLVTVFTTFSQLMNLAADLQQKTLSETENNSKLDLFHSLLNGLDKIPALNQLTVGELGDSNILKSFIEWFSTIDDPQEFMQGYISWANKHLISLVTSIDQIERKNYLKPGILSQDLCIALDRMSKVFASSSSSKHDERIISTESLAQMRKACLNESQVGYVKAMTVLENKNESVTNFFTILKAYAGKSLSEIPEEERYKLRQMYPEIQQDIAHENLELGNQLITILNSTGGVKDKSWTGWALGTVSYGMSYLKSSEVDKILATQTAINKSLDRQLQSEQLKLIVAVNAQEFLDIQSQIEKLKMIDELKIPITAKERTSLEIQIKAGEVVVTIDENEPPSYVTTPRQSLEDRVAQAISAIKSSLPPEPPSPMVSVGDLVEIKASNLKNIRGNIVFLQELHLSETINSTRNTLSSILRNRFSEKDRALFTKPPYQILNSDPDLVKYVKQVENGLFNLEQALCAFEKLEWSKGLIANTKALWTIASAAYQLQSLVTSLTPEARRYLAPVLQQINSYGAALSKIQQQSSDVSSLAELKKMNEVPPLIIIFEEEHKEKEVLADVSDAIETILSTEPTNKESALDGYIKQISMARASFLSKVQSTLAVPLVQELIPQEQGVPYINFDTDPPQISGIKKIINSLYYAEESLKILRDMGDTSSAIGKITAAHEGVIAVSHLYKSFKLVTEIAPEVQNLIQDNVDLLEPVFNQMKDVFQSAAWFNQFNSGDLGRLVGQGIKAVFPGNSSKQHFSLVSLVSEIPKALYQLSYQLGSQSEIKAKKLSISPKLIKALDNILELVAEDKISLKFVTQGVDAYKGLMKLSMLLYKENGHFTDTTLSIYQAWMKDNYPKLLAMLDNLEARYYLKPGTLSQSVIEQMKAIASYVDPWIKLDDKTQLEQVRIVELQKAAGYFFTILNEHREDSLVLRLSVEEREKLQEHFMIIQPVMAYINSDVTNKLIQYFNDEKTTLTINDITQQSILFDGFFKKQQDMGYERGSKYRADKLGERYKSCWSELLKIDQQQKSANDFFSILNKYPSSTSVSMLSSEETIQLKKHFRVIQQIMAHGNLDVTNKLSQYFNETNTTLTLDQIIQQSTLVTVFLKRQSNSCQLKIAVITSAFSDLDISPEHQVTLIQEVRDDFEKQQLSGIEADFEPFKAIEPSTLNNININLASIKKLNLSASVAQIKAQFIELSRANLSERVQSYFTKPSGESSLHVIKPGEPLFISQLKTVENGLSHLQTALARFEDLKSGDSVFSQLKALSEINYHAQQLILIVQNSSAKFKQQYNGSLIEKMILQLGNAVNTIDYNKVYTDDMKLVIYGDKNDPLAWLVAGTRVLESLESGVENVTNVLVSTDHESELFDLQVPSDESQNESQEDKAAKHIYVNLAKQFKLLEERMVEFGSTIKDSLQMKKTVYKEFLLEISKQEDELYLKPGVLLNSAIKNVNQFFLSMVLELDIPFQTKRDLLNEKALFFKELVAQTDTELEGLRQQLVNDPNNSDLNLKIALKIDKLVFFVRQIAPIDSPGIVKKEQKLFDEQFKVYLREQMINDALKSPILEQYKKAIQKAYIEVRDDLLLPNQDSAEKLLVFMKKFKSDNFYDYWIVSKGIDALKILHEASKNVTETDTNYYIQKQINYFKNGEVSIKERVERIRNLSKDKTFKAAINGLSNGLSLFNKFKQFIELVVKSVAEAITTGGNILEIYENKSTERHLENIGKLHLMKDQLAVLKSEDGNNANETPNNSRSFEI